MAKPKISFEKCDKPFIEKTFSLKRVGSHIDLDNWLNENTEIEIEKKQYLNQIRLLMKDRLEDWGEESLKMNFISLVIGTVLFMGKKYSSFANEKIEAEFDDIILTGKPDWFVASGYYKPENPFLFLQEYKHSKGSNSDPDGQLLAELLAARKLNDEPNEVYRGVVILGKDWTFFVLKNDEYCISQAFDASQEEELYQIYKHLKTAKQYIIEKVGE